MMPTHLFSSISQGLPLPGLLAILVLTAALPGQARADLFTQAPLNGTANQGDAGSTMWADDFVAPGYPLQGNDRTYQGYGTRTDAPVFAIAHGTDAEETGNPSGEKLAAEDQKELERILSLKSTPTKKRAEAKEKSLKADTLREIAGTLAFQKAVSKGYARHVAACEKRALELDRIFNFQPLVLEGRVLPPVIRSLEHATTLASHNEARFVERAFRIVKPARMVSVVPTWRDYLETEFEAFEARADLLPEDAEETKAWQEGAREGWDEGLRQARDLFDVKFQELVSDFRGMLAFRMLVQKGMVSMPEIAKGDLGIRAGDRVLHVNETVFRITMPAHFLPESSWLDTARSPQNVGDVGDVGDAKAATVQDKGADKSARNGARNGAQW